MSLLLHVLSQQLEEVLFHILASCSHLSVLLCLFLMDFAGLFGAVGALVLHDIEVLNGLGVVHV